MRRTKIISIRLTLKEYAMLLKKQNSMGANSLSDLVRKIMIYPQEDHKELNDRLEEIERRLSSIESTL